jgi:predicted transcriptional regulator
MKRTTDEIRYLILKILNEKGRLNVETLRQLVGTGLLSILGNAEDLDSMGFIETYEIKIGKRKYRELEITDEGKLFLKKIKKVFETK